LKREFTVVKYRTERAVVLRNGHPICVRVLALNANKTDGEYTRLNVEDLMSDSPQPAYFEPDVTLKGVLKATYPKGLVGECVQITRLPKLAGGKPYRYEIAELKVK